MRSSLFWVALCVALSTTFVDATVTAVTKPAELQTAATKKCVSQNGAQTADKANTLNEWKAAWKANVLDIANRFTTMENFHNLPNINNGGRGPLPRADKGYTYKEALGAQNQQQAAMWPNAHHHMAHNPNRVGALDRNRFVIEVKMDNSIGKVYMTTDHYENFYSIKDNALATLGGLPAHEEYENIMDMIDRDEERYHKAVKEYNTALKELRYDRARVEQEINRLDEYYNDEEADAYF